MLPGGTSTNSSAQAVGVTAGVGLGGTQPGRVKLRRVPATNPALLQPHWVKREPVSRWTPMVAPAPPPGTLP